MTDQTFLVAFAKGHTREFTGLTLKAALYANRDKLALVDLRKADLQQIQLPDANLEGADLREADLRFANLRGANLRNTDLRGVQLSFADLTGADLTMAAMYGAKARQTDFTKAILHLTDMRKVDLTNATLDDTFVRSARLPKETRGKRVCTVDVRHGDTSWRYLLFRDENDKFTAALGGETPLELPDFAAHIVKRLTPDMLPEAIDIVAFFQARIETLTKPLV